MVVDPNAVPDNLGKLNPAATGGVIDPNKGVTAEESSKQVAELQTKLKDAEAKATHWSTVAGQHSGELNELRQYKEKNAPYESDINAVIASKSRKGVIDQKLDNLRNVLGEEPANTMLDILDTVRQEDARLTQSQISALNEKLLLLEKPQYQKIKPWVEAYKLALQQNPNEVSETLYHAAVGKNIDTILADKEKEWEATKTETIRKELSANQTGGLTAPPALSPEDEADIQKTKDEILAVSKKVNTHFGV